MPVFPNVPIAPGVPPLLRRAGAVQDTVVALVADVGMFLGMFAPPQWGIFLDGQPGIVAGSVVDVEFRQEARVSTTPQEQGAFLSYNKVQDPFGARVTFAQGGSIAARTAFLQQVRQTLASLGLYSLVLPEITFASVNIVHQGFRRSVREGATLLLVDVWVEEIRVTGTAAFSQSGSPPLTSTPNPPPTTPTAAAPLTQTVNPTSADPANSGAVQAQPPTAAQVPAAESTGAAHTSTPAGSVIIGPGTNGPEPAAPANQVPIYDANNNWIGALDPNFPELLKPGEHF